jgi:citrate lyase subunit beta-like protein
LIRTPQRNELLYPRSKLVTTAKAFGLQAIDLVCLLHFTPNYQCRSSADEQVCVNYKDENALREESEEGRRLGFDGKVRSPRIKEPSDVDAD